MRHGESLANRQKLIVSQPQNGLQDYGLSARGQSQVETSVRQAHALSEDTVIVCSDFLRTRQTAERAAVLLGTRTPVQTDVLLRERDFGALELGSTDHYRAVWALDVDDPSHACWDVEPIMAVVARLQTLLLALEARYAGRQLLLVSHGDILQILQTVMTGVSPSAHRSVPHLGTAEIRRMPVEDV